MIDTLPEGGLVNEQIMAGLHRRDKRAFEAFWNSYYHRIYPICAAVLGNGPDATDMTVDILVEFVEKHAEKLSTPRALYAFLRQMAVRRSIRLRDKRDKITAIERDSQVGQEDEISPEEEAELNQLMPLLAECLERMTPKAQATLRMKYSNKISNEEIGRTVGGSKSYIGRVLKSAREALRKCIEQKAADRSICISATGRNGIKPAVALHTVDTLLSSRARADEPFCEEIHRMTEVLENIGDAPPADWVEAHRSACAECRSAAETMRELDESHHDETQRNEAPLRFPVGGRSARKLIPLAAAASVAAALSVVWMWHSGPDTRPSQDTVLVPKGGGDALHVAVQRNTDEFLLHPLDTLRTGDKIGLFYTAEKPGYLAVFSRDAAGETDLIYPLEGTTSRPITPGEKVPLSDGATASDGTGCEWLTAVFSDEKIPLETIEAAVKNGRVHASSDSCALTVIVAQARSVRVFPVRR